MQQNERGVVAIPKRAHPSCHGEEAAWPVHDVRARAASTVSQRTGERTPPTARPEATRYAADGLAFSLDFGLTVQTPDSRAADCAGLGPRFLIRLQVMLGVSPRMSSEPPTAFDAPSCYTAKWLSPTAASFRAGQMFRRSPRSYAQLLDAAGPDASIPEFDLGTAALLQRFCIYSRRQERRPSLWSLSLATIPTRQRRTSGS